MVLIRRKPSPPVLFSALLIIADMVLLTYRLIADPVYWKKYAAFVDRYPWGAANMVLIVFVWILISFIGRSMHPQKERWIKTVLLTAVQILLFAADTAFILLGPYSILLYAPAG
jgi:hypothetical protein